MISTDNNEEIFMTQTNGFICVEKFVNPFSQIEKPTEELKNTNTISKMII